MNKLNPKYKLFCRLYVEYGMNGTKAALDAGYGNGNPESASVQASRMLKDDNVKKYINQLLAEVTTTAGINKTEVLMGIKKLAYNPATPHGTQLQAFKLLGEYLNLFKNEQQIVINNNIETNVDVHEMTDEELLEELARLEEVDKHE